MYIYYIYIYIYIYMYTYIKRMCSSARTKCSSAAPSCSIPPGLYTLRLSVCLQMTHLPPRVHDSRELVSHGELASSG